MRPNRLIDATTWPPAQVRPDTIVLGRAAEPTTISSDRKNAVTNAHAPRYGAHDYRGLAGDPRVVTFETPPLTRDLTVVGAMAAELSVSVDATDAQIWVKVLDVAPDSTAFNLMSSGLDVLRLSYRNGARREPVSPGTVYRVRLGDLITGNTFKAGHRLRVVVSTAFVPDFEPLAEPYRLTVHHSDRYPSRLILPVLPRGTILPGR